MQQALHWIVNFTLPRLLRLAILAIVALVLVEVIFGSQNNTLLGVVLTVVCLNIGFWLFMSGKFLAKIVKIAGATAYMGIFILLDTLLQAAKTNSNPFLFLASMVLLGLFFFCAVIWGAPWLKNRAADFEAKYAAGLYQTDQGE
jgi:hypothetical protein